MPEGKALQVNRVEDVTDITILLKLILISIIELNKH